MTAREQGFATVWVVTAIAVVATAAGVATCYGAVVLQRHRAGAAADAVALVVALHAVEGPTVACREGAVLGRLNGARVTRCALDGADAHVTAVVRLPGILSGLGTATAQARAGPASSRVSVSPSTPR